MAFFGLPRAVLGERQDRVEVGVPTTRAEVKGSGVKAGAEPDRGAAVAS